MNHRRAIIIVTIIICALITTVAYASTTPEPIHEQYPGHISGNDLKDGITTFDMKIHGEWVTCIYAQGWTTNYASSVAITCDWNNQRR